MGQIRDFSETEIRKAILGGSLNIGSAPGEGALVRLDIPPPRK